MLDPRIRCRLFAAHSLTTMVLIIRGDRVGPVMLYHSVLQRQLEGLATFRGQPNEGTFQKTTHVRPPANTRTRLRQDLLEFDVDRSMRALTSGPTVSDIRGDRDKPGARVAVRLCPRSTKEGLATFGGQRVNAALDRSRSSRHFFSDKTENGCPDIWRQTPRSSEGSR